MPLARASSFSGPWRCCGSTDKTADIQATRESQNPPQRAPLRSGRVMLSKSKLPYDGTKRSLSKFFTLIAHLSIPKLFPCFDPPNGHLAIRTFLQVFRLQRPLQARWEPDAGKPSTIWTHLTKNRSPLVISFGSHRAVMVGGGTPVNSDPPVNRTCRSLLLLTYGHNTDF